MRNILITSMVIMMLALFSYPGFAEKNDWKQDFIQALKKGMETDAGFTLSEETVLETAIKRAVNQKAPLDAVMKIAINLKYNPYSVIKNIFRYGGEVDLDQIYMYAIEIGVSKQIIAKAAADATFLLGTPVFSPDEIAKSQYLGEVGLGYTAASNPPSRIPSGSKPKPFSAFTP